MLKIYFVVVQLLLICFCIIKAGQYEPFVVVTAVSGIIQKRPDSISELLPTSYAFKLPTKLKKIHEEWHLASEWGNAIDIPLCPELQTNNAEIESDIETAKSAFPDSNKCLFVKDFKENEPQICDREPQPSFDKREQDDGSPVICGLNEHQQLVDAQYYSCGTAKNFAQYGAHVAQALNQNTKYSRPFKPHFLRIYEICYDFRYKKTLWTRHTPLTPALLANPESPYKDLSNKIYLRDFSTEIFSLGLAPSTFSDLKKLYESADPSANSIYTLVPKDHMALMYWKNATTHMINSAPLTSEFVPLMKAINNGIFLASCNLFAKSQRILQIYTKVETEVSTIMNIITSVPLVKSVIDHIGAKTTDNWYEPNTWYRFLYDESDKSGVLIVLHNTRGEIPKQKECQDEHLTCDFKTWSDYPDSISDGIVDHAYCCAIPAERVKRLFSIKELQLEKAFDVQEIINTPQIESLESDDIQD